MVLKVPPKSYTMSYVHLGMILFFFFNIFGLTLKHLLAQNFPQYTLEKQKFVFLVSLEHLLRCDLAAVSTAVLTV